MEWVARENLLAVNRVLAQPSPAATLRIKALGKDQAYFLLRYQADEQNRFSYEVWEVVQMIIAASFFFFLLFGTTEGKFSLALALLLLILVLIQRFILTPEMGAIGKLLDFGGPSVLRGDRAKYQMMHYAYSAIEIGKWAVGLLLAALLVGRGGLRSSQGRRSAPQSPPRAVHYDR